MDLEYLTGINSSRPSPARPSSSSATSPSPSKRDSSISLEGPTPVSPEQSDYSSHLKTSLTANNAYRSASSHDLSSSEERPWNSGKPALPLLEQELHSPDLPRAPSPEHGCPLMSSSPRSFSGVSNVDPIEAYLRTDNPAENLLMKGAVPTTPPQPQLPDLKGKGKDERPPSASAWEAEEDEEDQSLPSSSNDARENDPASLTSTENDSLKVGLGGTHISVSSGVTDSSDSGVDGMSPSLPRPQKRIRRSSSDEQAAEQSTPDVTKLRFTRASDRATMSRRPATLKPHRVRRHKQRPSDDDDDDDNE